MPDDHHHHAHDDGADEAALAEMLDLDGEVLNAYWSDVLAWVRRAAACTARRRLLDLGAGTGTGTVALAQRFLDAEVVAVDSSEDMLRRVRAKALDLGLAHQVRTVQMDLDLGWPAVDAVDVTWASMSLHHLADPDRALTDVFAATRPGGLVAVAEFAEPLRFLPDDVGFGPPGLESRCLDALHDEHVHSLPTLGSDWSPRLEGAGFTLVDERTFTIDLHPPHSRRATRYAELWLQRLRSGLSDRLTERDLEALDRLVAGDGPESVLQRGDLRVRGARTVTLARRP